MVKKSYALLLAPLLFSLHSNTFSDNTATDEETAQMDHVTLAAEDYHAVRFMFEFKRKETYDAEIWQKVIDEICQLLIKVNTYQGTTDNENEQKEYCMQQAFEAIQLMASQCKEENGITGNIGAWLVDQEDAQEETE